MTIYYVIGYVITAIMLDVLLYDQKQTDESNRLLILIVIYIASLAWPGVWLVLLCHSVARLVRSKLGL